MKKLNQKILSITLLSAVTVVMSAVAIGKDIMNPAGATYSPGTTYTNHDGATYYNGIDSSLTGTALRDALHSLNSSKRKKTMGYKTMGTSTSSSPYIYTDYDPNGVKKDSNGQPYNTNVLSFYSGRSVTSYNKEHVWPNSHGGNKVEADIHMPRPTISAENSDRGNSFYVEGMCHSSNGWDPVTAFADNIGVYDSIRGECARIIFYSAIADTSLTLVDLTKNSTSAQTMGKLSDMLKWNLENPVNTRENNRNEGAEYLQGNRNPFIDHPEYACKIWGDTNNETRKVCSGTPTPQPNPDGYVDHQGTEADPYSVTNATAKASGTNVYILGQVCDVPETVDGKVSFTITDNNKSLAVIKATPNGVTPAIGKYVKLKGSITNGDDGTQITSATLISCENSLPNGWKVKTDDPSGGGGSSTKKGCAGSIVTTSTLLTVTALGGLFLALKKRKELK